jgi:cell division protein FtsI/penicillin-binding protein 2
LVEDRAREVHRGWDKAHNARQVGHRFAEETQARWPYAIDYYNKKYDARSWSNAETLDLAIGQGSNSQTVVNMAKVV